MRPEGDEEFHDEALYENAGTGLLTTGDRN